LLTIDIGNTNLTHGLSSRQKHGAHWHLATERPPSGYDRQIAGKDESLHKLMDNLTEWFN